MDGSTGLFYPSASTPVGSWTSALQTRVTAREQKLSSRRIPAEAGDQLPHRPNKQATLTGIQYNIETSTSQVQADSEGPRRSWLEPERTRRSSHTKPEQDGQTVRGPGQVGPGQTNGPRKRPGPSRTQPRVDETGPDQARQLRDLEGDGSKTGFKPAGPGREDEQPKGRQSRPSDHIEPRQSRGSTTREAQDEADPSEPSSQTRGPDLDEPGQTSGPQVGGSRSDPTKRGRSKPNRAGPHHSTRRDEQSRRPGPGRTGSRSTQREGRPLKRKDRAPWRTHNQTEKRYATQSRRSVRMRNSETTCGGWHKRETGGR